jgi:hypothetical protein
MKKTIKSIYFLFLILFTFVLLNSAKADIIDLKDYKKKPADILRTFLKLIHKTNMQICYLNGPTYYAKPSYIVFNPKIEILLPDTARNSYIVNCMFLEEYSPNDTLEIPHTLESLHNSLKAIEASLIIPIEIQWTYETIRMIVAPSFNGKNFSHQIILNIDPNENHRIERSTLTSTLRPTTINQKNNINYLPSNEEKSAIEIDTFEMEESESDSSSDDENYYASLRVGFIKPSAHFDELDLALNNAFDANDSNHNFNFSSSSNTASNPELAALFKDYVEYISHERENKLNPLRQIPSINLYEDNIMQHLEKTDNAKHQSQQTIKSVDFLHISQIMYPSDFDETCAISQNTPNQINDEE